MKKLLLSLLILAVNFSAQAELEPTLNCDLILKSIRVSYGSGPVHDGLGTAWDKIIKGRASVGFKAMTVGDPLLGTQDIVGEASILEDDRVSAKISMQGLRVSTPEGLKLGKDNTFDVILNRGNARLQLFCYVSRWELS